MSQSDRSSLNPKAAFARRDLYTLSGAQPAWEASLAAVSDDILGPGGVHSEDAKLLLLLLSFLSTSDKIPVNLFRGAVPRKRWNAQGKIEEVDAVHAGLAPELRSFLSHTPRLSNSFHELDLLSAISKNHHDQTYTLDDALASRVRERLRLEDHSFWRCQALLVAYRAIPWKYIESTYVQANEESSYSSNTVTALRIRNYSFRTSNTPCRHSKIATNPCLPVLEPTLYSRLSKHLDFLTWHGNALLLVKRKFLRVVWRTGTFIVVLLNHKVS